MNKKFLLSLCYCVVSSGWSKAIIDRDVLTKITATPIKAMQSNEYSRINTLIFLNSKKAVNLFAADIKKSDAFQIQKFDSFPAVLVSFPTDLKFLNILANHPEVKQISSCHGGEEELEISEQAILLKPSALYPAINNWWDNGYTGFHSVIGIIDTGIDIAHPSLRQKNIVIRTEDGSGYDDFKNGVRTAHGTGLACIYSGYGSTVFPNDIGIAQDAHTIVSGLAGTETDGNTDNLVQTLSTLDWMLARASVKPDIINYSFGNGSTNCAECSDWSGIAKIVDYVVNRKHILWVKSAGNGGFVKSASKPPFQSSLTTPADNYNALTVANMNPILRKKGEVLLNPDRTTHAIRYTSSRGPTLEGRKKPDISAPGNDTRTCAPDPSVYPVSYTKEMDYHDGYRLMGGTSSAAPHVGAAAMLLHDAGVFSPMAKKALLINSADAYTDSGKPGPEDPKHAYENEVHYPVMGSEWNRTYGWGYLNMQRAYDERSNLIEDHLTRQTPEKSYEIYLSIGGKVTLVHERRVGYSEDREWNLSPLSLQIIEFNSHRLIAQDASPIDTVHQVANCHRKANNKLCSSKTKPLHVLVKVKLLNPQIEGSDKEPFALAFSGSLE